MKICQYCKQDRIVKKRIVRDGEHLKKGCTPEGREIKGIISEKKVKGQKYFGLARCPECGKIVGAASEDFEHTTHSHSCKCGWKSETYKGLFITI